MNNYLESRTRSIPSEHRLSTRDLVKLQARALENLDELITDEGYFASSSKGSEGMYHAHFGRDTYITFSYLLETFKDKTTLSPAERSLFNRAINGFFAMDYYIAPADDPELGVWAGQSIHEARKTGYEHLITRTDEQLARGERPWFVDKDGIMKNWDSADATPLDVILKGELYQEKIFDPTPEQRAVMKQELEWCRRNIREYNGFAGFSYNPNRKFGGLLNQNWKDSAYSMLHENDVTEEKGRDPRKPFGRKPVEVNIFVWGALRYGADFFEGVDPAYAETLRQEAAELKARFNSAEGGFLMRDQKADLWYFAEALDEDNRRVTNITVDPILALWATHKGESVVEEQYIHDLVKRGFMEDLFNPEAGFRTYGKYTKVHDPDGYHNGPETYWPFMSGLAAIGLDKRGYRREAEEVLEASLERIREFGSNIEMFKRDETGAYVRWRDRFSGQTSALDQAWTAGMVYYATSMLLKPSTVFAAPESEEKIAS
ncbi:MAG: hypothetical protein ACM3IJ_04680 [Candidatus Levyibacteriota bacterium]